MLIFRSIFSHLYIFFVSFNELILLYDLCTVGVANDRQKTPGDCLKIVDKSIR